MPRLYAHFLPQLVDPHDLGGSTCVVIDVLRATTTIVTALASGAKQVIPCLEIAEARAVAAKQPPGEALLGGERHGKKIADFHLGNSPSEYGPAAVEGKTIFFTTTNGTRAMQHCREAGKVLLGAFVNLSDVGRALADEDRIDLVCAGTDGQITHEDVLLAGALVQELKGRTRWERNDQATLALAAWRDAVRSNIPDEEDLIAPLTAAMRASHGGRNLVELGMSADIDLAAQIDRYSIAPQLDLTRWRIT